VAKTSTDDISTRSADGIPILMYHSIGGSDRLAVSPATFAEHLSYLREHGYAPVPLAAVVRWLRAGSAASGAAGGSAGGHGRGGATEPARLPARPVVITFDDGYADVHERALPLLTRFGYPATVFVTSGWLRDAGPYAAGRAPGRMLCWTQVRELAAHGIEIGGHSHRHPELDQLRAADLRDELIRSRALLEDRLDTRVSTMAYPYGYSSARVRRQVSAAGYVAACAVANRPVNAGGGTLDRFALPRLTMRSRTSASGLGAALRGRGFRLDHALTKGYAVVRRSRYGLRRLRGPV
jgi:peptidoglycan/xylan/chitin deacetylase (PgdA/CDA1 family)